ncbi:unnamed protein product [Schistocephalus solidus]|uniref:CN hydrolase domain-containing protein n=1 Tax=Schistocephalus solidus TaxID=70667 RepID=A0A183SSA7_SCHSO|nr:unnamed protein product [Schistocephalus solidus]
MLVLLALVRRSLGDGFARDRTGQCVMCICGDNEGRKVWLKSETHLGDDEAVIRPAIGITDRLGYQHVLSISPPEKNIVQQLPASRPRVYPRGLLPHRKAEEGAGQQETVFRTGSQKKEAAIVIATETMGAVYVT